MEPTIATGPYRATRLWNEAVRIFRTGIPLKRHRRHIRMYENCFTGFEAVGWFHTALQTCPDFGPEVTRDQTIQLLRKFMKAGVFENMKGDIKSENFKDNGELYRLKSRSPAKVIRTRQPLASLDTQQLKRASESTVEENVLWNKNRDKLRRSRCIDENQPENLRYFPHCPDFQQKFGDVWKAAVLKRLETVLNGIRIEDLCNPHNINAQWVSTNYITARYRRENVSKHPHEDIPLWVIVAMECLINWPQNEQFGVMYPGFEHDVFKVLEGYFSNLDVPLITYPFYNAFHQAYLYAEYVDAAYALEALDQDANDMEFHLPPCKSVEDLMLDMTSHVIEDLKAVDGNDEDRIILNHLSTDYKSQSSISSSNSKLRRRTSLKSVLTLYETCTDGSPILESDSQTEHVIQMTEDLPPNTCFETAFTSETPVTRVIPQRSYDTLHFSKRYKNKHLGVERSIRQQMCVDSDEMNMYTTNLESVVHEDSKSNMLKIDGSQEKYVTFCKESLRRNSSAPTLIDLPQFNAHNHQVHKQKKHTSKDTESNDEFNFRKQSVGTYSNFSKGRNRNSMAVCENFSQLKENCNPNLPFSTSTGKTVSSSKLDNSASRHRSFRRSNKKEPKTGSGRCATLKHLRSKSGGYVNPALSNSFDDFKNNSSIEELVDLELDYGSALKTLQNLMKLSLKKDSPVAPKSLNASDSRSRCSVSSISSYYTAVSSDYSSNASGNDSDRHSITSCPGEELFDHDQVEKKRSPMQYLLKKCELQRKQRAQQELQSKIASSSLKEHKRKEHVGSRSSIYSGCDKMESKINPMDCLHNKLESEGQQFTKGELYCGTVSSSNFEQVHQKSEDNYFTPFSGMRTVQGKDLAVEAFQLLCLLLPPQNRWKLLLLLRFLDKVQLNKHLVLDSNTSTRDVVLKTFCDSVLRPSPGNCPQEGISDRIVAFLVENYEDIFGVPAGVEDQVNCLMKMNKMVFKVDGKAPVYSCEQVSRGEYEKQASNSSKALLELLDQIVADQKMSAKEKTKRLKRFKATYPHIYNQRFPDTHKEEQTKHKGLLRFASISRLKNLRL